MALDRLKKWLPRSEIIANLLGSEIVDYGMEVKDDEENGLP